MVAVIPADAALGLPDVIERMARVAERAATERVDQALRAAGATAKTLATSALSLSVALLTAGLAWLCLMVGAAVVLAERTGMGAALVIVGAVQSVVAVAMVLATRGALSVSEPMVGARR